MSEPGAERFYWDKWQNDQRVRLCGYAARGLWFEMLCIMAKAEPRGFLLVNGIPPTAEQLARLTGGPEAQVTLLLAELGSAGVYSRTEQGVIFNRRMARKTQRGERAGSGPVQNAARNPADFCQNSEHG